MKTATFIERERNSKKITLAHTIKKCMPWKPEFDTLKTGDVFTAEFSKNGKTMDFRIVRIIDESSNNLDHFELSTTKTFWIEQI